MKIALRIIFWIALFAAFAVRATNVQFNLNDPSFGVSSTAGVQLQLQQEGVSYNGTVTLLPITLYQITDTNGSATFTNLNGGVITGLYHWTASPTNQDVQQFSTGGDIWVQSTNLGTVASTLIGINFGTHTFPPGVSWTWSAPTADLRYSQSSNNLANYVLIGQLISASNSIVGKIQSTNGAVFYDGNGNINSQNGVKSVDAVGGFYYENSNSLTYQSASHMSVPVRTWLDYPGGATLADDSNLLYAPDSNIVASLNQATNAANKVYSNNPSGYITATATNLFVGSNYVTTSIFNATNGFGTNLLVQSINAATNQLANTNLLSGYAPTNSFVTGTNQIATNSFAQLLATNAALVSLVNQSVSNLNVILAASTNLLISIKQPASAILTNLSGTGAFTNILASGQNVNLTTNLSGNTVSINATNQTFLTNGITGTAFQPLGFYLGTNALPALTNAFLTTAGLGTYATTGYVGSAISAINANSNQYAAGLNVTITTNMTGTILYVNATNQIFLTNGISGTAFEPLGFYVNTNTLPGLTNLIFGIGANDTNFAGGIGLNGTNFSLVTSNSLATNFLAQLNSTNIQTLTVISNLVGGATNGGLWVVSTNGVAQNLSAFSTFGFGTRVFYRASTNDIGIWGGGSSFGGTYVTAPFGTVWTNVFNPTNTVLFSGGNYYLQSNGVSFYQSTNAVTWTVVNGALPVPNGSFFGDLNFDGATLRGVVYSTNLTDQIKQIIAATPETNFILSGVITNWTTNNSFSTLGSNIINALAYAQAALVITNFSGPTNGITAAVATNIANSLIYGATNAMGIPSGLMAFQPTNVWATYNSLTNQIYNATNGFTGGGGGSATNVIMGGVLSGNATNTIFSANGTNAILGLASGIARLNGTGTNTILTNATWIDVTNLSVHNDQNENGFSLTNLVSLQFNSYGTSLGTEGIYGVDGLNPTHSQYGGSIYIDSEGNAPYGEIYSTVIGGFRNDIGVGKTNATIIGGLANRIGNDTDGQGSFSYISGGVSNKEYGSYSFEAGVLNSNNLAYNFQWSDGTVLWFQPATNNMVAFNAQNGFAINTTSAGTNILEVNGNVDSTVGFSINGVPLSTVTYASGGQSVYPTLFVSGGTNGSVNLNGTYFTAGNYFTNLLGAGLFPPFTKIGGTLIKQYCLVTNVSVSPAVQAGYVNLTLIGLYNSVGNGPTNQPSVSIVNPAATISLTAGTNNPNGTVFAAWGSIYNQFSAANTNVYVGQWVNTNGASGWY